MAVGKTAGTLTAAFSCTCFAAGSTVTVSANFDGTRLDLDAGSESMDGTFTWDEPDSNHVAISARASNHVQLDNFAVRKLPLSAALSLEHSLDAGLEGSDRALTANPDGDRLDNFGEWAFGSDPAKAADAVAASSLVLVQPSADTFRFAHRRLSGFAAADLECIYQVSGDLKVWHPVDAAEESASPLAASPGYEAVTLSLPTEGVDAQDRLFLRIAVLP